MRRKIFIGSIIKCKYSSIVYIYMRKINLNGISIYYLVLIETTSFFYFINILLHSVRSSTLYFAEIARELRIKELNEK